MLIRKAGPTDMDMLWSVIGPAIRAGETYTFSRDMKAEEAIAYWLASDKETFVAEEDGEILGSYYMRPNQGGGGSHVCNCGYITHVAASGRGVAKAMCLHSLEHARTRGFRAMQFNFVVSTNERAVGLWELLGFTIVGRLPQAFDHPRLGPVDALVMFQTL